MRQEAEILELVKRTALDDSRISSAFLRGSRASGRIKRDVYQDYDIEYYVSDLPPTGTIFHGLRACSEGLL